MGGPLSHPWFSMYFTHWLKIYLTIILILMVIPWHTLRHVYGTVETMMTSSDGKKFPCYWPFVRGIHRSPVNSPYKGQWHGAFMFSLICVWINGWVNNREAGDLRRYRAHYGIIVITTSNPSGHILYIIITSLLLLCQNHVAMSFWRYIDAIITPCIHWDIFPV